MFLATAFIRFFSPSTSSERFNRRPVPIAPGSRTYRLGLVLRWGGAVGSFNLLRFRFGRGRGRGSGWGLGGGGGGNGEAFKYIFFIIIFIIIIKQFSLFFSFFFSLKDCDLFLFLLDCVSSGCPRPPCLTITHNLFVHWLNLHAIRSSRQNKNTYVQ